jgi:hypothetical protein
LFHERVKINKTAQVNVSKRGTCVLKLVRRCHGEQSRPLRGADHYRTLAPTREAALETRPKVRLSILADRAWVGLVGRQVPRLRRAHASWL